jgi:hypothetical protein
MSESGYNFINYKYKYEELLECESLDKLYKELQQAFGNEFSDYEFILYASNGSANPAVPIVLTGNKKKILLYISDEEILAPYHLCKHFTAIFKWHIPSNYDRDSTLFPLPLVPNRGSKEFPIVPINERHTNVFFSGNLNGSRYPLYKRLTLLKFVPDFPPRIETLSAKILSIIIKSYFNTALHRALISQLTVRSFSIVRLPSVLKASKVLKQLVNLRPCALVVLSYLSLYQSITAIRDLPLSFWIVGRI